MKDKKKIIFITLISIFGIIWLASLVFLGISTLSDNARNAIETWYESKGEDRNLNLTKLTMWSTTISTIAILITLLSIELKKKYFVR